MIKILHIINSLDIGGNERFVLQLIEHLPRDGFRQEVCVPDRGKDETRELERQCRDLGSGIEVFRVAGNLDGRVLVKLRQVILKGDYDIVHTHLVYSQIYGRLAAAWAGAKCIASSEQNIYEFKARPPFLWIERKLGRLTDRIIACSSGVREHLVHRVGIDPAKVVVVPNSVDTRLFYPVKKNSALSAKVEIVRRELGVAAGETVIGSVGHMAPQKGHKLLIQVLPVVRQTYPRARLVLVGKGILQRKLQEQARRLGVEGAVTFAGIRWDIPLVLNCFDVFVLPSLWEGFGTAIIEALACGVPVVASRVGGIPEIIEHEVDGLLVPPGSKRALAQSIIRILDNAALRRDMIYRGLRKAVGTFNVPRMAERMGRIYLQMFQQKCRQGRR